MSTLKKYGFAPDYAIHPGEILKETLEARGIKKSEFAERCGLSAKTISMVLNRKAPVTPETAIQFERVLGVSAALWNNLNSNYSLYIAKEAEKEELGRHVNWAREFPINELVNRGFIGEPKDPTDRAAKLLSFFGAASIRAWENRYNNLNASFRASPSFSSSPKSVIAWLRIGEKIAEGIDCSPYDKNRFKNSLRAIRNFTRERTNVFEPQMKQLCLKSGVALVFVSELPKTRLSGAALWLSKDKALIMMSLRYKTDDHFWFTFFHEAAHLLSNKKKNVFVDEGEIVDNIEEKKANRLAENILIPVAEYRDFNKGGDFHKMPIVNFAQRIGIAPGIIVGRLQGERKIQYDWHNSLKRRLKLVDSAG